MLASNYLSQQFRRLWADSSVLTATCALMLVAFVFSIAGIVIDHRVITGVPAWLKPAKFAISTAIFSGTIAWLYRYISVAPLWKQRLAWVLALVQVLEVAIIDLQAVRGTTSHFNFSTHLNATLFGIMGVSIGVLWLAMIGVLVLLFRQKFVDPDWGWALRLAMLISVIGAAAGGAMVGPTQQQREALAKNQKVVAIGGHTVGAPDGGPGLPGVGWSKEHGDLRISHFFGLHALQAIPFLAWFATRRPRAGSNRQTIGLVFTIAGSYFAFIVILAWQALRGQSIVAPDAATLSVLTIWFAVSLAGVFWSRIASRQVSVSHSSVVA